MSQQELELKIIEKQRLKCFLNEEIETLEDDYYYREEILLTKKDRPVAVTVSVADWEELVSLRIERGIAAGLADVAAGRVVEMTDAALEQRLARSRVRSS